MNLAFIPLYIKYLGIESYGLIGIFAVLQAWLSLLDMGMTPTLSREMARFTGGGGSVQSIRDLLRSIEYIVLGIAVVIATGIALGSEWLAASWLKTEELSASSVSQAFAIMGLVAALKFFEGVYRSSIVGLQRQVLLNIVNSFMATLRGLGAVGILIWVSPTIHAFFLWQGLVSIATLGIFAATTYTILPRAELCGRFSMPALRSVWHFAGGMIGITFLSLLLMQVDKVMLSKLLTLSDFGYYTLASVVAGALYALVTPITQAWYPRLCQLVAAQDSAALIRSYHQGAQLVSVIAGSAAIVLILFAETILHLWTRDAGLALRVAPMVSLLVLGNLLNALMYIPYHTQLAHAWTGLTVRINIISVLIIVPAILWTTPRFGALGAASIWVLLNAGYVLIGIHFMYRRILTTEKWQWYVWDLLAPLTAATVTAASLHWVLPNNNGVLPQLASLVIAFSFTMIAAGLAASHIRERAWFYFFEHFWRRYSPNLMRKK